MYQHDSVIRQLAHDRHDALRRAAGASRLRRDHRRSLRRLDPRPLEPRPTRAGG